MTYTKTVWNPGLSPGVSAEKLNKIEQGIFDAHKEIETIKLKRTVEQALNDRVVGASGAFFDEFDGTIEGMTKETTQAYALNSFGSGTSVVVSVDDVGDYQIGEFVTIYDTTNVQEAGILAVDSIANTLTFNAINFPFAQGTIIARSTAIIDETNQTANLAEWRKYNVTITEV